MAKPVILNFNGESASFKPTKVDPTKVYGTRKRIAIDAGHNRTNVLFLLTTTKAFR